MMRATACAAVLALCAGCATLQQGGAATDDEFAYVNEDGEEIFGGDYRPEDPPEWNLALTSASLEAFTATDAGEVAAASGELFVHFVDVGQGSGAILEFPCGVAVIDTGGQYNSGTNGGRLFVDYLDAFFESHPQHNNTIDVLFTTHPHKDHLYGLRYLLDDGDLKYAVLNVVDNGQSGDSGSLGAQTAFRTAVITSGGGYAGVSVERLFDEPDEGQDAIDPIDCEGVDPAISVLWGSWTRADIRERGGVGSGASNPNNHSLVIRVEFGEASLLFPGDLEDTAAADMLKLYEDDLEELDVDVYVVSHHGADDDTSDELLGVLSPQIAVISMGDSAQTGPATAWDHGHPRTHVIDMMQEEPAVVSDLRVPARSFPTFDAEEVDPVTTEIDRAIHGTGWEGDLILRATADGAFELLTPDDIALGPAS